MTSPRPIDAHPIMDFNRNQTGLNPDFPSVGYHCVSPADARLKPRQQQDLDRPLMMIGSERDAMRFSCRTFNWEHLTPNSVVLVVMLQFSVTTELPATTPYFIEQIVRQAPDSQPIIVVNNPGMCGSSRLPRFMRRDVRAGVFDSLAESIMVALKGAGVNHAQIVGFSMGARLALAMGAITQRGNRSQLFPTVTSIAAAEPPGLAGFGVFDFFNRFTNVEGERLAYYQQTSTDDALRACIDPDQTDLQQAMGFLRAVLPDWKGNWALMTGLRRSTLIMDLETLEDSTIPTTVIQGSRSAISARLHDPMGSVRLRLLPGDSHAFGEEGRRLAWHLLRSQRS